MNRIAPTLLVASALLLCPIFAALPDDTTLPQTVWASLLSALVAIGVLAAVASRRAARQSPGSPGEDGWPQGASPAAIAFAVLLGLAGLSVLGRLLTHHSAAYLGMMLRGWGELATDFILFALCRHFARAGRGALYALLGAAVAGSTAVSAIGVNEYLLHFVAHETSWRVFATSTPDFLAGYLVVLLPVTLALFLGAPAGKRLPLLFGLIIVLQMATLLTTGSRFALISLLAAFAVFAATLAFAVRRGMALDPALRRRILGIALVVVLAGLVAARPILSRLDSGASQGNSGAFRVWTWRGAARMAAANPILGAGVGTWIDTYPRYALTGFTRLAHNSYLQMADECGFPALLALVAALGFIGAAGTRGLKSSLVADTPPTPAEAPPMPRPGKRRKAEATVAVAAPAPHPLSFVAPADDRLVLCGLLASLAAGAVQNLIDSDWYVFFIGITFWAMAGLTVGTAEHPSRGKTPFPTHPVPVGAMATLLFLLFLSEGVAAWFGYQAQTADDPGAARFNYATAQAWDPLNARYPAELGARVEARVGNAATAESLLRRATRMEPSAINYRRLGAVLDAGGKRPEAAAAYQAGLEVDPNSLDLLLALAKDSPPARALGIYRRVAALEDSPVGQVRAIGEVTEARFAIADAALGSASAADGTAAEAIRNEGRAQRLLETYVNEGGTLNQERQAQIGSHPNPAEDSQFRDLYANVMAALVASSPVDQKPVLQRRAQIFLARFQAVVNAATGDTAATPAEAAAGYERAAAGLEQYAADAQAQAARPDSAGDAAMRDLYKRVMDSLIALTPADQRAVLQTREQDGLQKFAQAFPTH